MNRHSRLRLAACLLPALGASVAIAATSVYPPHPKTVPDIVAADVMARDKAISDDAFQGRGPGTKAGEAAAQWIADEMKRIGLKPGNHGSYFQTVPSVNIALDAKQSSLAFNTPSGAVTPNFPEATVYWTPQYAGADVNVKAAQVVFVGYGVVAPEYHWNDYAGLDVKGKTVVILINDPGNEDASPDPTFFKGKAMTYYGRWTYKFEEAARQGAAAAIIVHETIPAAYGWQVVRNSNSGNKLWLANKDKNTSMVPVEGWINLDTARDLFKRAGLDYDAQKAAANKPGFTGVPLKGETLDVHAHSAFSLLNTRNIIGVIPGYKRPDQFFLYTAHWDHLGVKPDVAGPDKIYNGAIDNGMGVSSILEIGEAFAHGKRPQRSIAIIDWTLEEQGLLGSQYFAQHPVWPLNKIVGGVNLDGGLPRGHSKDLVLIGSGASELEDMLSGILKTQNRVISPDPEPEKGGFYRSDHISLSRVGVPMLDPSGSSDLVVGGKDAAKAIRDDYRDHHYHQPSDEFNPNWDLTGVIDDLEALHTLGDTVANSDVWPNWYKDNEFRAIRDKSMAGGKK
jgi:Zn-dependent M28 family amino/carboxypeptidase